MSAKSFIAELESRKLLSDRTMQKLRNSLAEVRTPLSAEALAKFLVARKLISKEQANDVLSGLTRSGINLEEEDAESVVGNDAAQSSSVFASHITTHPPTPEPDPDDGGHEDEISLAPISEDEEQPEEELVPSEELHEHDEIRLAPLGSHFGSTNQKSIDEFESEEDLASLEEDPEHVAGSEEVDLSAGSSTYSERLRSRESTEAGLLEEGFGTSSVGPDQPPPTDKQKAVIRRIADRRKKGKPSRAKKRWDSPLVLFGGGILAFLLLSGGTIAFLLNRESGDQKLTSAREASKSGAYPQAIEHYQDFLASSSRHPEFSLARIELAMVRIRQASDAKEFAQALSTAETELKAIEDEPAFESSHQETAALLPQIAEGLAKQAEQAPPMSDDSQKLVDLSNKALELCNNVAYIPKPLRDETRLANVRETLERVERRQQSQRALSDCLKEMEEASAAGKPIAAYAARTRLVKEHPELSTDKTLTEAIKKSTAAEQAAVKFVSENKTAETSELPTPWVAALAVANHHAMAPIPGVAGTACVRVDGAIYGLEGATGRVLWRRFVGYKSAGWPVVIDHDVLVADAARHELLRLDAATGKLIWRQVIGEEFADPLIVGDRGYLATDTGRLYVLDLKSGARAGFVQFPQPLHVAPAIDRTKTRLYVAGDQASLYSITLPEMKCTGVYFLGHAPGTIQVAPLVVMDKVAVIENNGVETSRLHLLSTDKQGAVAKQQAERRLNGLGTSPPLSTGRGLIVITDRGQLEVYDIAAGNEGDALTPVATRDATGTEPLIRHMAVIGRNVWVGDTQLTKYNIVPTGSRLPVEEIENNFAGATFDHPLTAIGTTLIEVNRPKGRAGVVVAALDTKQGHTLWQTDLAMPPAGAPIADDAAKAITVANSAGLAFRFDEAAMRSRVQDQPLPAPLAPPEPPVLTTSINLGQGRAAFCAPGSDWTLWFNPAQGATAKWLHLDSPLVCEPTLLGAGLLLPSKIGQVFYLSAADGARLATPFQPRIDAQSSIAYKPAAVVGADGRQFVISDGNKKIYSVALVDQPQPHLESTKERDVGPRPITTPTVALGNTVLAVAGDSRLVRFKLPALESAGESNLPAPIEWGPFVAGDAALLATVDQKLVALTSNGDVRWQVSLEHGQLAGAPLVLPDSVLLAYRKGILERRALADGKSLAKLNVEQPLATGPVEFMQKIVVSAADGTILVVDRP